MKILITGGTGFIGKNLLNKLIKLPENHEIAYTTHRDSGCRNSLITSYHEHNLFGHRFHCDLTQDCDVKYIFKEFQPDIIYHLAGRATVKDDEFALMQTNVHSTHLLLNHCMPNTTFVLASTLIVHGDCNYKIGDGDIPNKPTSIYGISKLMAEKLVWKYANDGKINGRILRLVATCGANQTHGLLKDIIAKLKSDNPNLELLGDAPGSTKGFVYIQDTIDAFILAGLKYDCDNRCFIANVASDDQLNVEEVAKCVMNTIDIHKPIKWLGAEANWKNDNKLLIGDNSYIKYHGWNPKFPNSYYAVLQAVLDIKSEK